MATEDTANYSYAALSSDVVESLAKIEQQISPHPWSSRQFQDSVTEHSGVVLLGDHAPLGYLVFSSIFDESELLNLGVAPDHQCRGLGRALLQHYLQVIQPEIKRVFLEVRAGNIPAIALYKQAGFIETGRRKNYYTMADGVKEDALTMSLTLESGKDG